MCRATRRVQTCGQDDAVHVLHVPCHGDSSARDTECWVLGGLTLCTRDVMLRLEANYVRASMELTCSVILCFARCVVIATAAFVTKNALLRDILFRHLAASLMWRGRRRE